MIPMLGTGPTAPINTEESYLRRKKIIDQLYANAANETSEWMVRRLARSWAVDHDLPKLAKSWAVDHALPKQGKNGAKIGQKITPLIG